jgi:hypothetical protein
MLKSNVGHVLARREAEILKLRYGIDDGQTYTAEEVGRIFRVTPERVCQIEAKAIRKLKRNATVLAAPRPCRATAESSAGQQASAGAGPGQRASAENGAGRGVAGHSVARGAVEGGAGRGAAGDNPAHHGAAGDNAARRAEGGDGPGRGAVPRDDPAHRAPAEDDPDRPLPPPRPPEAEATAAPVPADLLALVRHLVEGILTLAADAQARATLAGLPPQPRADPLEDLDGMLWASDTTLAASHHLPHGTLKKRLSRLRRVDPDCFIEVANRRPREPQFLYREERVMPVIVALKTGSQRPAKNTPVEVCPSQGRFPAARRGQRTGIDNTGGVREIGSRP